MKQHWQQIVISVAIVLTLGIAVFQTVRQDRLTTPIANINVRTGPNINYQTKAILKKGQAVYIVQKTDNWYKVRYDDHHFGWVASWLINQSSKIKTATN